MGSRSGDALLHLPVQLHGRRLGHPVDLLVDRGARHAVGFVVVCADDSFRFLPFAAAQPRGEEIAVGSELMLLDDVAHYRGRSESLRALRGGVVHRAGRQVGTLRDVLLSRDGTVAELLVACDGHDERIDAAGATIGPERAAA